MTCQPYGSIRDDELFQRIAIHKKGSKDAELAFLGMRVTAACFQNMRDGFLVVELVGVKIIASVVEL
jgi:hypothetical protein